MPISRINPFVVLTIALPFILTWAPYATPFALILTAIVHMLFFPANLVPELQRLTALKVLAFTWIVWAMISCQWHFDAPHVWQSLGRIQLVLLSGGFLLTSLPHQKRHSMLATLELRTVPKIILISFIIFTASLLLFPWVQEAFKTIYDLKTIDRFSPSAALWCLIFWPTLELAKHTLQRWNSYWTILAMSVFMGVLCLQAMAAAIVAFVVAALTYLAVQKFSKLMPTLISLKIIVLAWLSPFIAYFLMTPTVLGDLFTKLPFSWRHRLYIWHFVSEKIFEKPWLGWGYFSARYFPGGGKDFEVGMAKIPMHPHNMFLQLWLDFGVVGAVLFSSLIIMLFFQLKKLSASKPMAFAVMATYIAIELFSFSIWQSWWFAGTLIAVIFSGHVASWVEEK